MAQNTPNFTSTEYDKYSPMFGKVTDVYNGVDTAANHLQKYNKETKDDYEDRQAVATLNNYVFRVVNSFKDIIFRQPLTVETTNSQLETILSKIDFTQDINSFAKELTVSVKRDGYAFILVDAPIYEDVESKADELDRELRPYWSLIERDRVKNWQTDLQGNLKLLTVEEDYTEADGKFATVTKVQYRVFYGDGLVEVWRDDALYETVQSQLKKMTIVKVGKQDIPPLYDLTRVNINHMNRQSELNSYIRIAGAPIPVSWGMTGTEGQTQVIGVNQGINFSGTPAEADFEWKEMSGSNAGVIREQVKADEEAMLDIAVSLVIANQPRTATEVNADNTENESKLSDTAEIIEQGLNKALDYTQEYLGSTSDDMIKVNRDFDSNKLTPQEVAEYRNDYLAGIISWETLMSVLVAGEVYPEMTDAELTTEKARIDDLGGTADEE